MGFDSNYWGVDHVEHLPGVILGRLPDGSVLVINGDELEAVKLDRSILPFVVQYLQSLNHELGTKPAMRHEKSGVDANAVVQVVD